MNERSNSNTTVNDGKKERQKKKRRRQKDNANKVINKHTVLALANSWRITLFKGPDALGNFCYFAKRFVIISVIQVRPVNFFPNQILSSITKLHTRRCPALEQDKFLSGVKTVQILQFARHDLKKKPSSAPTITKLKLWQRQILSTFLEGPNKFCQSSASGP